MATVYIIKKFSSRTTISVNDFKLDTYLYLMYYICIYCWPYVAINE